MSYQSTLFLKEQLYATLKANQEIEDHCQELQEPMQQLLAIQKTDLKQELDYQVVQEKLF